MLILNGPQWFHGLDSSFEIVAFLVTLFIAIYSFRIFFLTWERKHLYFTLAFLSISGSYAIRAAMDWFIYRDLLPNVPNLSRAVSVVVEVSLLHIIVIIISTFLLLSGFLLLLAVFMGLKDPKMLIGVEAVLVLITVFAPFIFEDLGQFIVLAHIALIVMLVIIVIHLFQNHSKQRTINSLLVMIAVGSLLLAHISYFIIPFINEYFYAVGHGLQLLGYLLLLVNIILVLKK
jgi:hypothetical protein